MIYIELNQSDFIQHFQNSERKDQFSQSALEVLYDFYEELGENMELDIITICCEWTEYASAEDLWVDFRNCEFTEDGLKKLFEELPSAIEVPGGGYLVANT